MSNQTQLRNLRKNFPEAIDSKYLGGDHRDMKNCPVCGQAMYVSVGQIITAHKGRCRKEFKRHNRVFDKKERDARTKDNKKI